MPSAAPPLVLDLPSPADPAPQAPTAGPPKGAVAPRPTDRVPGVVRQARWFGVGFALLQFFLYTPPKGVDIPFPQYQVGLLIAAALALTNLLTRRRPLPVLGLAVDTAVVLSIVWLFSFENPSAVWTLLLIPVIEAAMCWDFRGAMAMWGACAVAYIPREIWASHHYGLTTPSVESVTYQLGVVLLVAVTTGHLARNFTRTSEEHRRARAESERRAELLGLVAQAGRKLAALDSQELLTAVVDATVALGFEGVELCRVADGQWHVDNHRGLRHGDSALPIDAALPAAAAERQDTVLVEALDTNTEHAALGRPWFAAGYQSVVATPIRMGDTVVAALVAGRADDRPVTASEVECAELLAAQAGVGLANVRMVERVRHQALHDALTGLPNQLLFEDRVAQALAHAGRSTTRAALLFVDLDRFKKVNDTLGHDFGNELLRQVGGRLLGVIRSGDTVARMGGDEFTLLLPNLQRHADAARVAAKVLAALRAPFMVAGHQLYVTASVGISVYPHDGLSYEALLKHADIAMYRSKAVGGNHLELYGSRSADEAAYPRLALEADLHHALPRHELRLVFQPQLDLTGGVVRGVEALVRWSHPSLGEIGPTEFLPLAEEAGLLSTIDAWVLESACARGAEWLKRGAAPGLRVAVNVSGRHLHHPRFADSVLSALARTGLPASCLELEVTEGSAVTELHEARDALVRLRRAGVRVAIDDFGTGYSMLSRLRDFPLDTLKIDKSFIAEIQHQGDQAPIVSATIAMARSLGLEVVAEGVEIDAQLGFLRDAGCDLAQGFLLSHPVEADRVIDLITPVNA
jgi:diguanylate cyclase (GGDEF)-like protein